MLRYERITSGCRSPFNRQTRLGHEDTNLSEVVVGMKSELMAGKRVRLRWVDRE